MSENIINLFNKHFDYNTSSESVSAKEITKEEENILTRNIKEIISYFTKGNMTLDELVLWCNGNKCNVITATDSNNVYTISFEYQGKNYKIRTNKNAAKSSTDDIRIQTYTGTELTKTYKLSTNDINTYFDEVASIGNEKNYAIKDSYKSKFNNLSDLINYKYDNTRSFFTKINLKIAEYRAEKVEEEDAQKTNHSNKILNNYRNQLAQYNGVVEKFNNAISNTLNQYLDDVIDDATFDKNVAAQFDIVKKEVTEANNISQAE